MNNRSAAKTIFFWLGVLFLGGLLWRIVAPGHAPISASISSAALLPLCVVAVYIFIRGVLSTTIGVLDWAIRRLESKAENSQGQRFALMLNTILKRGIRDLIARCASGIARQTVIW